MSGNGQLRIAYRTFDPFADALSRQAEAFTREHQEVEVEAVPYDPLDLYEAMITGDGLLDGSFDLALLLTDWLPQARARGVIVNLAPRFAEDPPPGWPEGWAPSMRELQADGMERIEGIAYHDGPIVLMYRSDLFDDPIEKERFAAAHGRELTVPETWAEFVEVAKWFTRPDDGLYGATIAGYPDEHNNVYDFLLLLWSAGGTFLSEDGSTAMFGDEHGRWALQFYRDLYHEHRVLPPECLNHESVASGELYASGRAAMMWNWIGFSAVTELPSSRIQGANRVALVPRADTPQGAHSTLNVYWVMTMAAGTSNPDPAWKFLRHLATPEMDKETSMAGGNGTRLSTWNDPEVLAAFPYYSVLEDAHRGARTLPARADFPAIAHEISEMTRSVLHEEAPIDSALGDAVDRVNRILSAGAA